MQVYPDGIRHIRADKRVNEWKTPGKKTIVRCAVNQRQVVIALTGGELVYFEMDPVRICVGVSPVISRYQWFRMWIRANKVFGNSFFVVLSSVWPAERVHREEGDVC